MWQRRLSAESAFCRACVSQGYLTQEQMEHAAQRYRLGRSRDDGVIFWQINQLGQIYDGKIMYYRDDCHRDHQRHPNWVSHLLKHHYGCQNLDIPTVHCLFGTHLVNGNVNENEDENENVNENLNENEDERSATIEDAFIAKRRKNQNENGVAVVESEKSAVILSEWFPQCLWLATGGLNELTAVKLFPLRGWKVILFPDTDSQGRAFGLWYQVAQEAQRLLGQPITVSPLLEQRATVDQKARKIDLVDFLFEAHVNENENLRSSLLALHRKERKLFLPIGAERDFCSPRMKPPFTSFEASIHLV